MFLLEYAKGQFINANQIQWISVRIAGKVVFSVLGDPEGEFTVDDDFQYTFLNHLQCFNTNITDLAKRYGEINS